jgi:hypothetical protein
MGEKICPLDKIQKGSLMRSKIIPTILLTFFLFAFLCGARSLAEPRPPYLPTAKQCVAVTNDKKTGEKIARTTITLKHKRPHPETHVFAHKKGRGKIYNYTDAQWDMTAEMKIDGEFIKPLTTRTVIKDPQGRVLEKTVKSFDYASQQIVWEYYGQDDVLKKKKIFPIKGRTCDDVTLIYFLKPYLSEARRGKGNFFYLLTNEPQLFKTNITYFEDASLTLPWGTVPAVKLKLTGDVGIIDDILDKYVPHTYVWYRPAPPFEWLKYQGLEKNFRSRYIETYVVRDQE